MDSSSSATCTIIVIQILKLARIGSRFIEDINIIINRLILRFLDNPEMRKETDEHDNHPLHDAL
jgi:hypothetical protein